MSSLIYNALGIYTITLLNIYKESVRCAIIKCLPFSYAEGCLLNETDVTKFCYYLAGKMKEVCFKKNVCLESKSI